MLIHNEKYPPLRPVRILLVEDHPIYREGLHLILSFSKLVCEIVAEASDVDHAVAWLDAHPNSIDLAILDYFLPDGTASEILDAMKVSCPASKVLVITGEVDRPEVKKAVEGRVDGFISKDIQSSELLGMVTSIVDVNSISEMDKEPVFTQREMEIIKLCGQGKNTKQIADELFISHRTVERHKNNIFNKLGVNTTTDLMKYAVLRGLL